MVSAFAVVSLGSTRIPQFNRVRSEPGVAKTPTVQVQGPFWFLACAFIGPMYLGRVLMIVACSEAECIVFATEGLLLAHEVGPTAEFGFNLLLISDFSSIESLARDP
jgi:hypothetical protein